MYSDILARQNDLLVLAFPIHGCHFPVGDYDRDTKHDDEEDIGLESTTVDDGENALDDKGHAEDEDGKVCIEFPSVRPTRGAFLMAGRQLHNHTRPIRGCIALQPLTAVRSLDLPACCKPKLPSHV